MLQLSRLAYHVAEAIDGRRGHAEIAELVSGRSDRRLAAGDVRFLVERKLAPAGIVVADEAPREDAPAASPLDLTTRRALVPASVVRAAAACLRPLFRPGVVGAVLAWLVALDAWLFLHHGVGAAAAALLHRPVLVLAVFGLVVLATALHECGHAAACSYGGAQPGAMGVGLYLAWPVFFTNVTDAYRLDRRGRLRTDLGGVYLNAVFAVACGALYLLTRFEPLVAVVVIQHFQILQQLTPLGRLDGYYVLTDLAGVPDILARVRPTLLSLLPGREPEPRVAELRPWVRAVVSAYVLTVLPLLAILYVLFLVHLPRFVDRLSAALRVQLSAVEAAFAHGHWSMLALAVVQTLVLSLPAIALALLLARTARWVLRLCWRRLAARPRVLAAATFAAGVVVAVPLLSLVAARPGSAVAPVPAVVHETPARATGSPHAQRHRVARATPARAPAAAPEKAAPAPQRGRATSTQTREAGSRQVETGAPQVQQRAQRRAPRPPATTTAASQPGFTPLPDTAPAETVTAPSPPPPTTTEPASPPPADTASTPSTTTTSPTPTTTTP